MPNLTIGIEKYKAQFSIPYEENMTLGQFHEVLKKALGFPCKLNIFEEKNKKMKDIVKGITNITVLNNDNLLSIIKYWIGNFINVHNECFKNQLISSIVHSLSDAIIKKEEEMRLAKYLPTAKNFKDYDKNSPVNSFYSDLLQVCDFVKNKVKNNDSTNLHNTYDSTNKPKDQKYTTGGGYCANQLANLSNSSTCTESHGLRGGNNNINTLLEEFDKSKLSFVKGHEIYLKTRTVVSDCINIEERIFLTCTKCKYSNISVINLGNINIIMNDFLKSYNERSFNGLLKYYYKNNNIGVINKKTNEFCKNCKNYNLEYYRRLSTLPEVLIVEFDLNSYYINSSDSKLKEDGFYWALQEEISLKDYYDTVYDNYSDYELTSFICHCGNNKNGHFVSFSKIDNVWYYFNDLQKKMATKIGDFLVVKILLEKQYFGFIYGGEEIKSKLKISTCFYEKNKIKGYEKYVDQIKNIIKNGNIAKKYY